MKKQQQPKQTGIIAWFANNSVAANLLMILLMMGGLVTYHSINKKMQPDIVLNNINITMPYLGASPEEVEKGVVVKIEEAIQDVDGIEKISSVSSQGFGSVTTEIDKKYDLDTVMADIKSRVDAIPTFPQQTEKAVISKVKFQRDVMWLSVYGDMDRKTRQALAQEVKDEIVALPDVSKAQISGNRPYEVKIEVSENTLREYHLTMDEITNSIRSSSKDIPGGAIKTAGGNILLKAKGQSYSGYDFSNIILRTNRDGTLLRLADVAKIIDGFAESEDYAKFDGKPASNIRIQSTKDENILKVAEAVRNYIKVKNKTLPQGAKIGVWGDVSFYLKGRLDMMFSNLMMGAVLVFLVLALFLRIRLAFWVMMGIPVSFLGTLFFMPYLGAYSVSINMLSIFGFILVLGIIVDDAIVIGESVYTTIKKEGHSTYNVIKGANKVALPATFGVLTTIAAFAPVLMIDSVVAPFFISIAMVVSLALTFSLLESKWILPSHLAHMKFEPYDESKSNWIERLQHRFREGVEKFTQVKYKPILKKALHARYSTMAIFIASLFLALGLVKSDLVKVEIFPNVPSDFIRVSLVMNEGSSTQARDRVLNALESKIHSVDAEYIKQHPKSNSLLKHSLIYTRGDNGGGAFIEITKSENRKINAYEIERRYRNAVGTMPEVKELRFYAGTNAGGGAKLAFNLTGVNYVQLEDAAKHLETLLHRYDGVHDIRNSYSTGTQEIALKIKPEAEILGLTQNDLGRQVRQAFYGEEAQRIQRGPDEVKVMVRYPEAERKSISDLEKMRIRTLKGTEVPISEVADVSIGKSYSSINRIDRKRAITVSADTNSDKVESGDVIKNVFKQFMPILATQYPSVKLSLEGSSKFQQELAMSFLKAFVLSLFLIYALIAIPMKSYSQPLIIMSVIPFGIIGAIIGHILFGKSINMMSMFGIIALGGVVVNDSLILVDFINKARAQGVKLTDAVIEAGMQRFRPIILTSLTTFFGLFPLYFETSLQAQYVIPMALSLGFGILFATVITLFLIPAMYLILEDIKAKLSRKKTIATDSEAITDQS